MNEFKSWNELTERQQLLSDISDDYKSLNGMRPRWNMDFMTIDDLRQFHNQILTDLKHVMEWERQEERNHNLAVERAMTRHSGWSIGELTGIDLVDKAIITRQSLVNP